ncbi:transmembrane protein 17B-like [Cetorhinus maximus]
MELSPIPEPLRRRLSHFSQSVFSVGNSINNHMQPAAERERGCWIGQESATSLPLQMCLYFNLYFFPFWCVSEIVMLELKYYAVSAYYRIVLWVLLILISWVEIIRLYLGYIGNLQEKVPELAGFWLLTLLLQIPMTLFGMSNPHLVELPLDYGVNIIYLAMLGTESLLTFRTLRHMVKQLELRFHMTHFDSLEETHYPQARISQTATQAQPFPRTASTESEGLTGLGGLNWGHTA